jgi:serine phosphatase RsbU (regulator of sigma subunit)
VKKLFILTVVQFIIPVIFSREGSPYLTHFATSSDVENQNWAICQDVDKVMLFANRKGIIAFDGKYLDYIKMPTIPYAMQANPADGKIYIGGEGSFGYIERDMMGTYKYKSLAENLLSNGGLITRIIFNGHFAWLYGEQSITRFNLETGKPELELPASRQNPFTGMIVMPGNTFINVYKKGLFRVESDTLFPIVTGYLTEEVDILFSLPYSEKMVLIGLSNGMLSLFDGIKYYRFYVSDDGYLRDNILSDGITMGDTAYAFSTLEGGAVVVNKRDGRVLVTINNQSELPDDEVFGIGSDDNGGLWLSHQYGLTRADLSLPVANYSVFPGLSGNISSALMYNGELHVATSEGVYYLAEIKDYTSVDIIERKLVAPGPGQTGTPITEVVPGIRRKNIFTRIFGKKTSAGQEEEVSGESTGVSPEYQVTRKTISKLKSIKKAYRKIEGINEKCRQLVTTPYGILAATNRGLFVINDRKASLLAGNHYINSISRMPEASRYFVATANGYFTLSIPDGKWIMEVPDKDFSSPVYSMTRAGNNVLWLGGDNIAYRSQSIPGSSTIQYTPYRVKNEYPERYYLDLINDTVFLFTESGIYFYSPVTDGFDNYMPDSPVMLSGKRRYQPFSNLRLMLQDDQWILMKPGMGTGPGELSLLKLFDEIVSVIVEERFMWIVDGNNRLFGIDRQKTHNLYPDNKVFIKSISSKEDGMPFNLANVTFERGDNTIYFKIISPWYPKQNAIHYQYYINKIMPDWSSWSTRTDYEKYISRPGNYTLMIRAKDLWGNISEPISAEFTIRAPFTETIFFYLLAGLVILLLIILIIRVRERQLHVKTRQLEEKVRERTAEIESRKQEITASIEYAGKIQMAMLPMEEHFNESFPDYFLIFRPRDIVSGDFYWIGENESSIFFTVADCTGHGVPGAFLSTLGISTLNEIMANNRDLKASSVLNLLRAKTKTVLHQTGRLGETNDGMDIAFCVLNKNRQELQFSGAFISLVLFQGGALKEFKADRMPIGIHHGDERLFTNHVISVQRGDTLYICSDGFSSQFGGPDGAVKYKTKNLKILLSRIYHQPLVEQRNILENEFFRWKGSNMQVDDITILGIRI